MAVAWLDAARYADSYGYQSDQLNTQWPYRDWVVRAFNDNLPYDQFLTWQLAGDLLPNPTRDQILATAFNRLHRMTNEGGSIAEEWLVENASDRVHTFGTAMLGLTVECCRCHDHKYDPITMRDYYSLSAFFNSIDENGMYDHAAKVPSPSLLLPTDAARSAARGSAQRRSPRPRRRSPRRLKHGGTAIRRLARDSRSRRADADLAGYFTFDGDLDATSQRSARRTRTKATQPACRASTAFAAKRSASTAIMASTFPSVFEVDRWDAFTLDFWMRDNARNPQPVVVLQRTFGTDVGYNGFDVMLADGVLEAAALPRLARQRHRRASAEADRARTSGNTSAITYDGSSTAAGLRLFLDGKELPTRCASRPHPQERRRCRPTATAISRSASGSATAVSRTARSTSCACTTARSRRSKSQTCTTAQSLAAALADPQSHRDAARSLLLFGRSTTRPAKLRSKLRDARRQFVEAEEPMQEVPVMEELPEPRPTYILPRGAYDAPKTDANRVGRDTFARHSHSVSRRMRRAIAWAWPQWLTDPHHPLTARVFVNRLWANFFGRGLVATPENFGQQGALPTHPELLDWLARDFVDHGWDIKRLCRKIVLSATYRQDSRLRPELRERDPENQSAGPRPEPSSVGRADSRRRARRVRLARSPRWAARPCRPISRAKICGAKSNTMSPAYQQSTGKDLYRRSLYSVWKRTAPLPNMMAFDAPTREVCTVARGRTNTPLQALVLLNDVQFVEAARALAASVSHNHVAICTHKSTRRFCGSPAGSRTRPRSQLLDRRVR